LPIGGAVASALRNEASGKAPSVEAQALWGAQARIQQKTAPSVVKTLSGSQNEIYSFSNLIQAQPSDRLVSGRHISGDQIAAYFHTGGTTGTPKLIQHTHDNQVHQAWAINLLFKSRPGANLLFGLPLFHWAARSLRL
jgi:fatty-acyl-CoA synthase